MPKTKEQALANPAPGDRWSKGKSVVEIVLACEMGFSFKFAGRAKDTPPFNISPAAWLPAFRRWASNAEYLGGAE